MKKKATLLKIYRITNNLTQEELADKLNTSITSLRAWETRSIMPGVHYILKIQDLLGGTLDQIIEDFKREEE